MQKGRQFVYKELIATEIDYIRDLECVVNVSVLLHHFKGLISVCIVGHCGLNAL